ncbi:efflux RND transporter periplasmic adaptor subunit [Burkholderia ambifaria]|uniref:efflux RND transporter periplasmic adaptor subunit n=1 Tax=Burkholderia ambifaria TaxID=152480 RepID=UPI001FC87B13|nr:efflux RND transporter periplasmic adaptor subunit [Burkholderia ambifaria]
MKNTKKTMIVGLALTTILLTSLGVFRTARPAPQQGVFRIQMGTVESTVSALGTVLPATSVDVGAQVSGQILKIHVTINQEVKKGQLLVEIDPKLQQAKVDADRAQLDSLNAQAADQLAQLRLTQLLLKRQQALALDGATRTEDIETAQANVDSSIAKVATLHAQARGVESSLRGDEALLGYTKIYSPIDGAVLTLDVREGQTLNAVQQTPLLMRIADLTKMTVWSEVSEADINLIKRGMKVRFSTLAAKAPNWTSTVRDVLSSPPNPPGQQANNPASQPPNAKAVLYPVVFDVENLHGQLLPQMSAQVFFIVDAARNVTVVPLRFLTPVPGVMNTFTAGVRVHGVVQTRTVVLGIRNRTLGQVVSGLAPGDELVHPGEGASTEGLGAARQ